MKNQEDIKEHFPQILEQKSKITGELISQELIEQIGDLAYNTLAEFLTILSKKLPQYQKELERANQYIQEARRISEPFMNKNTKHKHNLECKGKNSNQILTEISQNSKEKRLLFLKKLGQKIEKDANTDQQRGRKQLSSALFSCANILLELSKKEK